jgi:hypothetical protein
LQTSMRRRQATWSRDEAGTRCVNVLRLAGADEEVLVAQARVAASLPQRVDLYFERSTWRRILCVTTQPSTERRTTVSWACSYCRLFAQVVGHYGLRRVLSGKHRLAVLRRACGQRHRLRRAFCRVCGILHANVLRGGAQAVRDAYLLLIAVQSSRATSAQALLAVAAERIQGVQLRAPTFIRSEAHTSCCVLLRWASCMGSFVMPSSSGDEALSASDAHRAARRASIHQGAAGCSPHVTAHDCGTGEARAQHLRTVKLSFAGGVVSQHKGDGDALCKRSHPVPPA